MAEPFVISALKGDMAVPFFPHFGMFASMAEPFLCKNHLLYSLLFMAAPFANLCVSSMAEPFLCRNYLLCLSLFMAAPLADLYVLNMAEPFVISALKGDMAVPFSRTVVCQQVWPSHFCVKTTYCIHCYSWPRHLQICAFQIWPCHFCVKITHCIIIIHGRAILQICAI
jgi:hypothetical protein